jgi:hypothetical protein
VWPYLAGLIILIVGGSDLHAYRRRAEQAKGPGYRNEAVTT